MGWRHVLRVLHRDAGYLLAPLVVAFSVSGIAVNHIDQWNPSWDRTAVPLALGPLTLPGAPGSPDEPAAPDLDALERAVVERVPLDRATVRGRRSESARRFTVFLDEGSRVDVDPATGTGTWDRVRRRPFLFEVNALHLNSLKGAWTWVSDAFAVALAGLAISGVLLLPGRKGLAGRGKWFLAAGTAIPAGFLVWFLTTRV